MSRTATLLVTRAADKNAVLDALARAGLGEAIVAGPHADSIWPQRHACVELHDRAHVSALAAERYDRVLLHGFAPDEPIPSPLLRDMFSRRIRWIRRLSETGNVTPYRPLAARVSRERVLYVFPGAPIPLDKGANQRAFGVVHHLNRHGIDTDLLLTTASRRDLPWLADVLQAVVPEVHTYRNDKPPLPPHLRLRREAERVYRLARGSFGAAPDLFVDRVSTRSSKNGKAVLTELVASRRYRAVIVSFAWMAGLVDAARAAAPPSLRWVCDTHDVQFVRGSTQNARETRSLVSQAAEERAELDALAKFDSVLAISESDGEELARHLGRSRVVLASSGFDYAYREVPAIAPRPPFTFGFLGRSMKANVAALELLVKEWWPAIRPVVPGSRLVVAGTVCDLRECRRWAARQPDIELLGFLPSLDAFYARIDVALNPVVVQGGLNFKSLEPLAAGKLLVTTSLGAKCLGPEAPVLVADGAADVAEAIRALAADPAHHHRARVRAQTWCMERFSDEQAFAELRSLLRG